MERKHNFCGEDTAKSNNLKILRATVIEKNNSRQGKSKSVHAEELRLVKPVQMCNTCQMTFDTATQMADHLQSKSHIETSKLHFADDIIQVANVFNIRILQCKMHSEFKRFTDIRSFLDNCKSRVKNKLNMFDEIRFECELFAHYVKSNDVRVLKSFTAKPVDIDLNTDFDAAYAKMTTTIETKSGIFQDSGWRLEAVSHIIINLVKYVRIHESKYTDLLTWWVAAALHPADGPSRKRKVSDFSGNNYTTMADVIELSSDEEESKGNKKENGDVIELFGPEPSNKRLRLSPFKSDIIVLLDEELDNENGVENNVNLNNVPENLDLNKIPDTGEALTNSQDEKVQPEKDDSSNVFDLTEPTTSSADDEKAKAKDGGSSEDEGESEKARNQKSKDIEFQIGASTSQFLDKCAECISENNVKNLFRTKLAVFKKVYNRASQYVASAEYENLIESMINRLDINPEKAIVYFQSVFRSMEDNYDRHCVSDRIRRYEEMLTKLNKKLKALEEADVDFEDEENSNYMKMQRYRERAFEVYKKIKEIEKTDPNQGRLYHGRIDFAYSSYPEINRALNKKYQNREKRPFPTFEGVNKCIRKCVKENDLNIPEHKLKAEIKGCFEQLGNLLQKKRKIDLANVHMDYLGTLMDDPAKADPELNRKLQENQKQYHDKMQQVLNKFQQMQEEGVSVVLSEDSDDSNAKDSDEEQSD